MDPAALKWLLEHGADPMKETQAVFFTHGQREIFDEVHRLIRESSFKGRRPMVVEIDE